MKHTYIFRLCDVESINDDLNRLVAVLRNSKVSYRAESEDRYYLSVQVFTDEKTMHHIAHRAGFSGEQLRVALPAARRNGDMALARASKRLNALRKESEVSHINDEQFLKNLSRLKRATHATDRLNLRLTPGQKELYEGVAGKRNLSKWILKTLDRAAVAPVQMPGGTKRSKRSA